jgi:hypothetical protein
MIDGYFGVPRLSLEMTNLQTDNLLRFLINTLDANVAED